MVLNTNNVNVCIDKNYKLMKCFMPRRHEFFIYYVLQIV